MWNDVQVKSGHAFRGLLRTFHCSGNKKSNPQTRSNGEGEIIKEGLFVFLFKTCLSSC